MNLSQLKEQLSTVSNLHFVLPSGQSVPGHFHITEAGLTTKQFIDCGGSIRTEKTANLQIWVAQDIEHRLTPQKLAKIISLSEKLFSNEDLEVEVEYQADTIGRYGLETDGENFLLTSKQTDCLAKENCGVPEKKQKLNLTQLQTASASCCAPGGGCC